MRWRKDEKTDEAKANLTPMIDVIFQLLIFFVFTAKFISFEGQLQAYLPKDKGMQSTHSEQELSVTLDFVWLKDETVLCRTFQYHRPDGSVVPSYRFNYDPRARQVAGGRWLTETVMRSGKKAGDVSYDYRAPDFAEIEDYLGRRKSGYERVKAGGKGLPVTISFDKNVPWQMVTNIIDICHRKGITEVSLQAEEMDT